VAPSLRDTTVGEIERRLDELREHEATSQRTSVLTHTAWVPLEWRRAANRVLEVMGERVPSRTILLHPDPGGDSRLDAEVTHECFSTGGHETCAETVRIWLRGETARAPASVVQPLQIADLPAFLRWRGKPRFGSSVFEQMVAVHDRLVVDSSEWGDRPAASYPALAACFPRVIVSDLAWLRSLPFRAGLADRWPFEGERLHVTGRRADGVLLQAWLRSRLKKEIPLRVTEARELRAVEIDGEPVRVRRRHMRSAGELLSDALEVFGRDPIYEAAVRSV
jgi:Glucose-6-phosphate dehydrogenase subunit